MGRWIAASVSIVLLGSVAGLAQAAVPPTNAQFIAQADQICAQSNPKNIRLLKRSRRLITHGHPRAGGRLLIRNEHFELDYYGRIAALPRPADASFNQLVDRFLALQQGQARARIKVGRGLAKNQPPRKFARFDSLAVRLLREAGTVSRQIGFTQC